MDDSLNVAGRKLPSRSEQFDPQRDWAAVTALAAAQDAVFAVRQAYALGASSSTLSSYVKAARLFRVHKGVLSLVPPRLLTSNGRRMAAVLACGEGRRCRAPTPGSTGRS